jgi:hypothetical protein
MDINGIKKRTNWQVELLAIQEKLEKFYAKIFVFFIIPQGVGDDESGC